MNSLLDAVKANKNDFIGIKSNGEFSNGYYTLVPEGNFERIKIMTWHDLCVDKYLSCEIITFSEDAKYLVYVYTGIIQTRNPYYEIGNISCEPAINISNPEEFIHIPGNGVSHKWECLGRLSEASSRDNDDIIYYFTDKMGCARVYTSLIEKYVNSAWVALVPIKEQSDISFVDVINDTQNNDVYVEMAMLLSEIVKQEMRDDNVRNAWAKYKQVHNIDI